MGAGYGDLQGLLVTEMNEDEFALYSAINHAEDDWTPEASEILKEIIERHQPRKLIETRVRYIHRDRPGYIYDLPGTVNAELLVVTDHWLKDNAIAWVEERVIYWPEDWSTDI